MIYFDNSATTMIDSTVLETYNKVNLLYYGNPSSLHAIGETASGLLKQSRSLTADLLGVLPEEIFFTSGGTEGDNWAIKGTAIEKISSGKHLITTQSEHPAVLETFKQLELLGWDVTYLPVNQFGVISLEGLRNALKKDTVLVSVMAVNNETGSIQPIEEIGRLLEAYPTIHFHVDSVQAIGKTDIKLGKTSRIDMAVFSGHKFHGPKGTGFVYIKKGRRVSPLLSGGGQEANVRSGTENIPGIVSMAKALKILLQSKEEKQLVMNQLMDMLKKDLSTRSKVTIFSPELHAPHILCFGIKGIRGEVIVHALEKREIYVSTTSACSSKKQSESSSLIAMGIPRKQAETAIRVSLSEWNTADEMAQFIDQFDEIYKGFNGIF